MQGTQGRLAAAPYIAYVNLVTDAAVRSRRGRRMPERKPGRDPDVGGRKRLLEASLGLFAAKGYAATTVRDILRVAGVTAPVLYYHFGSKEGLFVALLRDGLQRVDTAVQQALGEAGSAAERVRAYCVVHATIRREYAEFTWIIDAIIAGPPEAAPKFDFKGVFVRRVGELADLVRTAVAAGEFRACEPIATALTLLSVVDMAVRTRLIEGSLAGVDDPLDGMLNVVLGGLATGGPLRLRSRSRKKQASA